MTAPELFETLAPAVEPLLFETFQRRDLCILATRVVLDVGEYFGLEIEQQPVRAVIYNKEFAAHVEGEFPKGHDVKTWNDGSWSVGLGCGFPRAMGVVGAGSRYGAIRQNKWNGHLIAVAGDYFGDFAIRQAERLQYGIITGPAIVGPRDEFMWRVQNEHGTTIEYRAIANDDYLDSPDWCDKKRRQKIVGALIRLAGERAA